ncbi:MAG: hypothetical protein COB67_13890 [SAR324 cluster bacterium]|uniref:Rpn family recombination-promoting nuclease/putative transposase n=1 Tax=SAR324 cluster bacterium TaxID=2024889 RepID=A0A2A4SJV3_9DELT|nr:MAG: hypothetical protein COB67_13890 [SAR324 cluster bacterium]
MLKRRLISFDWALKRLLRSKTNFEVLEGFLSELLKEEIQIQEVLESESNKEDRSDKFNRVDLKVKNEQGEILIIEVQYEREFDYLQRILFGTSKVITEHMEEADPYHKVVKVISINILYFDLGHGEDYVYHGTTQFKGLHQNDELRLTDQQKEFFNKNAIADIYPEYYLLKINQFDDKSKDPLDEWIYFLKNGEIKDEFKAKGLKKARKILDVLQLSEGERLAYDSHIEDLRYQASMYHSSFVVGKKEGFVDGELKGEKKGMKGKSIEIAINLLDILDDQTIALKTGLSVEEVAALRNKES